MSKSSANLIQVLQTGVSVVLFLCCSEPFPTYQEPQSVLQAHLDVTVVDTIQVQRDQETGEWYLISTPMVFAVTITNLHDDLLSGESQIEGAISITAFTQSPKSFLLEFAVGNLISPQTVNGAIALEPGEEALLRAIAYPILEDGTLLIEGEPGGPVYGPISCLASGSVRLFSRIQSVAIPQVQFAIIFKESNVP